jgi:hypothetical protein
MAKGHHILHHAQEWSLRPEARQLRETHELKVFPIDLSDHQLIHKECPPIPLLGFYALKRTLNEFYPVRNDTMATMDNLMSAIEVAGNNPRAHRIEKELAQLVVWSIDLQRPFIADVVRRRGIV